MNRCTNSFPHPGSLARLIFLIAAIALPALGVDAQTQPSAGPSQKASINAAGPCSVEISGEVTHLVKNGVELSVGEDWDCDRVADAYDNCVGMANPTQTDSDGNGRGDACEAVSFIWAEVPAKSRSNATSERRTAKIPSTARSKTKAKPPRAIAADKRSRSNAKKRRNS
jgi:hypothetical protein